MLTFKITIHDSNGSEIENVTFKRSVLNVSGEYRYILEPKGLDINDAHSLTKAWVFTIKPPKDWQAKTVKQTNS